MRFREFKNIELTEGGDSKSTQFNSEVGLLAAMCGVPSAIFDPNQPEVAFAHGNKQYTIGQETFDNIRAQAENYNPAKFNKWVNTVGPKIANTVLEQLKTLGMPAPTELAWVGSQNQSSVADVKFVNHPVDGVSVKEAGAPTLANLTAKSLGLEGDDPDVFRQHAQAEWDAVKQYVFAKVIEIAKAQPGKTFAPTKPKYSITYMEGGIPQDAKRLKAPKAQPTPQQQQIQQQQQAKAPVQAPKVPPEEDTVDDIRFSAEGIEPQATGGYFVINFGDGTVNEPEDRIMADLARNAPWQRVFGDYFQAYWNKDAELKRLGASLFAKIGQDFVSKIKQGLADQSKLNSAVKMGGVSYFYATPKATYYVPSVTNNKGLILQQLDYGNPPTAAKSPGAPTGTNQFFTAAIGYANQPPAGVLIYIRYANGIFQANPTVRVQKLTNPEGLGWVKL